jgi:thermostable 8-oxoguanine DNA glycosylase
LYNSSFGQQNQDQNELNEQWQPKKRRTFTNRELSIIENFKIVIDYRKSIDSPSQYRIAREI